MLSIHYSKNDGTHLASYWLSPCICSVVLCGYWFLELPDEPINDIKVYHPASGYSTLPDFFSSFKGSGERPVYIGFGSMEELGFFSSVDCVELLGVLNEGTSTVPINLGVNTI